MRIPLTLTTCLLWSVLTGCEGGGTGFEWPMNDGGFVVDAGADAAVIIAPETQPACVPDATQWRDIRLVHHAASGALEHLITQGALEVSVANSLALTVLLSNEGFFQPETVTELRAIAEQLGALTANPFAPWSGDGTWRLPINDFSEFSTHFYRDAQAPVPLVADVFVLESYLQNAHIETSLTWDEMKADLELKNTYTLTWEAPGPLVDVLFPLGEPIERRVELHLSIFDFAWLGLPYSDTVPDYGPFLRLSAMGMDSVVQVLEDRDGVRVTYEFEGRKDALENLRLVDGLQFDLLHFEAVRGTQTLQAVGADLRFASEGLKGRLATVAPDLQLYIVDDFGEGASSAETSYWCADAWPPPEFAALIE